MADDDVALEEAICFVNNTYGDDIESLTNLRETLTELHNTKEILEHKVGVTYSC